MKISFCCKFSIQYTSRKAINTISLEKSNYKVFHNAAIIRPVCEKIFNIRIGPKLKHAKHIFRELKVC